MKRVTVICLVLVLATAAVMGGGTALAMQGGSSDANKAFLATVEEQFTAFQDLDDAMSAASENADSETPEGIQALLDQMHAYIEETEGYADALEALKTSQVNELENLRTACAGHIRIAQYMVKTYVPIFEYSIELLAIMNGFDAFSEDMSQLDTLQQSLNAYKAYKAPDSMMQMHESLTHVIQLAIYAFQDVALAAALEDEIRMMAAQCEAENFTVQIALLTEDITKYSELIDEMSEKVDDRLEAKEAELRDRLNDALDRYGL